MARHAVLVALVGALASVPGVARAQTTFSEDFDAYEVAPFSGTGGWLSGFSADGWSTLDTTNPGSIGTVYATTDDGYYTTWGSGQGIDNHLVYTGATWDDVRIDVQIYSSDNDAIGVVIGYQGATELYLVYVTGATGGATMTHGPGTGTGASTRFNQPGAFLYRVTGGSATELAWSVGVYTANVFQALRVMVEGDRIRAYLDTDLDGSLDPIAELLFDVRAPVALSGEVGLYCFENGEGAAGCAFDDLTISAWDLDGDGHVAPYAGGDDCDDTEATVYPGAPERCDGLDNDCDSYSWSYSQDFESGLPTEWTSATGPITTTNLNTGPNDYLGPLSTDVEGPPDGDLTNWQFVALDLGILPAGDYELWFRVRQFHQLPISWSLAVQQGLGGLELWSDFMGRQDSSVRHVAFTHMGGDAILEFAAYFPYSYSSTLTWWGLDDVMVMPAGVVDEGPPADVSTWYVDADSDGHGMDSTAVVSCFSPSNFRVPLGGDCDETDPTVFPGATELCDGQLDDCEGSPIPGELDDDGDGYIACTLDAGGWDGATTYHGGGECDDGDDTVYPGAPELCDGLDNDCDGSLRRDEYDDDDDGYAFCEVDAQGWDGLNIVVGGGDCDEEDATVNPGAIEVCDGIDNDCGPAAPVFSDDFEAGLQGEWSVGQGSLSIKTSGGNSYLGPLSADQGSPQVVWVTLADQPAGTYELWFTVENHGVDATDTLQVHNGANGPTIYGSPFQLIEAFPQHVSFTHGGGVLVLELSCDTAVTYADAFWWGLDDVVVQRMGLVDDGPPDDASTWYLDYDSDGFGATATATLACDAPDGTWIAQGGDCDDNDAGDAPPPVLYADADADGYGDPAAPLYSCDIVQGYVTDDQDCDDQRDDSFPGQSWYPDCDDDGYFDDVAIVQCLQPTAIGAGCDDQSDPDGGWMNELDTEADCDDEDFAVNPLTTWFFDADGDGHGDGFTQTVACAPVGSWVLDDSDCDDGNPNTFMGAPEICDGQDNDCDVDVDEDVHDIPWYRDSDGDGYGDDLNSVESCEQPAGYVAASGDCDDADPDAHPGATEIWYDGIDGDCDGASDYDQDGDGFETAESGGVDCDDTDPDVNPDAIETYDALDRDCDGFTDPTNEAVLTACACDTSAPGWPSGLLLVGALALRRRREGAR